MSESEYKDWVLADYDKKMLKELLPGELLSPTPGNIKAEVVKICEQGLDAGDEKILRSFVGEKKDAAAYRSAFSTRKADPFRSLERLLENREVNTHIKNIDLLALLIDFRPRPYHPNLKISDNILPAEDRPTVPEDLANPGILLKTGHQEEPALAGNEIINQSVTEPKLPTEKQEEAPVSTKPVKGPSLIRTNKRVLFFILILLLGVGAGVYTYWHQEIKPYTGHEKCMIWNYDRYEPVECNTTTASQSYPINWRWVKHFRRITTPDTLTLYSVGKVWYANYKGRMEFFNDSAAFPQDTNRRLLPMTDHILKKYVYHIAN